MFSGIWASAAGFSAPRCSHCCARISPSSSFASDLKGTPIDNVNLMEELGDVLWYLGIGCRILSTTVLTLLRQNIAKLFVRYRSKFTAAEADARNLSTERATLERSEERRV